MAHVFLSYSRTDRLLAHQVTRDLEDGGVTVWSDRLLTLGGQWLADIGDAIHSARALVLLASPVGLSSHWVRREVSAARKSGIPVIPMLAGGARYGDLPAYLAGINGVDLDEDYAEALTKVVFALSEPAGRVEHRPTAPEGARTLLALTSDVFLVQEIAVICRPIGLAVVHCPACPVSLADAIGQAHVVVLDEDPTWDVSFAAGYAAGAGRWVICVLRSRELRLPQFRQLMSVNYGSGRLAEEICAAAFMPLIAARP